MLKWENFLTIAELQTKVLEHVPKKESTIDLISSIDILKAGRIFFT